PDPEQSRAAELFRTEDHVPIHSEPDVLIWPFFAKPRTGSRFREFGSTGQRPGAGQEISRETSRVTSWGVLVLTKFRKTGAYVWASLSALTLLALAGCGGSGKTNVVSVNVVVSPQVLVSQSTTATATVSGSTDTAISAWACTYAITTVDA